MIFMARMYEIFFDKINIFLPSVNYIAETIEEIDNKIHHQTDYEDDIDDDEIISKLLHNHDIINDVEHI